MRRSLLMVRLIRDLTGARRISPSLSPLRHPRAARQQRAENGGDPDKLQQKKSPDVALCFRTLMTAVDFFLHIAKPITLQACLGPRLQCLRHCRVPRRGDDGSGEISLWSPSAVPATIKTSRDHALLEAVGWPEIMRGGEGRHKTFFPRVAALRQDGKVRNRLDG